VLITLKSILLISILGGIVSVDRRTSLRLMISQPLFTGLVVGLLLGDARDGFIFGAVYQTILLGVVSTRGSRLPDLWIGGVVGTALFVVLRKSSGADPAVMGLSTAYAVFVAVIVGVIAGAVYRVWESRSDFLADLSMELIEREKVQMVSALHVSMIAFHLLFGAVLTFIFIISSMPLNDKLLGFSGMDRLVSLKYLEILIPFIGIGFLVNLLAGRGKYFWFAAGFLVTVVLVNALG